MSASLRRQVRAAILSRMVRLFDPGPMKASTSLGLLILRLATGLMLGWHGLDKLMEFNALKGGFPDPLGIGHMPSLLSAIGTELGCGLLIAVGFATRIAVIPAIFTMVVAAFVVHADDPWSSKELAVLYGLTMLPLVFTGAGQYSIDGKRPKRRETD